MPYQIVKKQPPQRNPMMLVTQPAEEGAISSYDMLAPGLYPGEHVVRLDSGELVALSVTTQRLPNGGGMEFRGWARAIQEDGQTLLDSAGNEMELEFRASVDALYLHALESKKESGDARVSREIMLMMLGEPPTMRPIDVDPDAPAGQVLVDGHAWDPARSEAPIMHWADDVRLNASIRHAIALASRAQPEVDVAALLHG